MVVILERVCGHTFALNALKQDSFVLDLGMNQGDFAIWIVSHTPATCFGIEPVPALFSHLPAHPRIHARQVAVGGRAGSATLQIYKHHCASLHSEIVPEDALETVPIRIVTLSDLITEFRIQQVDLLKIDIEGAELDLFDSVDQTTLAKVAQITIEFHDFMDRRMLSRVRQTISNLREFGFWVQKFSFFDNSDVLAINKSLLPLSAADHLSITTQKYIAMIRRKH